MTDKVGGAPTAPLSTPGHGLPTLYLIRHGQTAWTQSGQHTGITDIPLSTEGKEEARALAPVLQKITFAHVLTSPLLRARQTCVLESLVNIAVVEPDLMEWNYGDYEGRRTIEIHQERPDWMIFRDGCPGGETPEQISARADRLIERLNGLTGNIALFSHAQFGCSLAMRWIGLDVLYGQYLKLDTASVSMLGHKSQTIGTRNIVLWNWTPGWLTANDFANG
jgi:probable phosphoglycerate mutase